LKFAACLMRLQRLAVSHQATVALKKGATNAALSKAIRALGFQPDPELQAAWRLGNGSADNAGPGRL